MGPRRATNIGKVHFEKKKRGRRPRPAGDPKGAQPPWQPTPTIISPKKKKRRGPQAPVRPKSKQWGGNSGGKGAEPPPKGPKIEFGRKNGARNKGAKDF